MKIRAFITHKLAEHYSDCQDHFNINPQRHSIAVADGMSQSIFPQWWAEELTKAYTDGKDIESSIEDLQKEWLDRVNAKIIDKEKEKPGSAWRLQDNITSRKGAGATICGITFNGLNWTSYILGDTSLIAVDSEYRIIEIINSNRKGFGNHPDYFDSINCQVGEIVKREGIIENEAFILMVSDALGEFLEQKKFTLNEEHYVKRLISLTNHEEFVTLVQEWRDLERMHNDDSTCVVIEFEDTSTDFNVEHSDDLQELVLIEGSIPDNTAKEEFCTVLNQSVHNESILEKNEDFHEARKDLALMAQFIKFVDSKINKKRKFKNTDYKKIIRDKFPSIIEIAKKYLH